MPIVSTSSKGKGKAKQVEFSQDVEVQSISADEESDLTDLTEIEDSLPVPTTPSPRRLRSKGEKESTTRHVSVEIEDVDSPRRVTPARKAKNQVGSMRESSSEDEEEEDQLAEESDMDEEGDEEEVEATPKAVRRTPLRKRLRSRAHLLTPPSDGDDEGSDAESVDVTESVDGDEEEEAVEGAEDEEEEDDEEGSEGTVVEEDEEAPISQPRTLRNGKVVGEEVQEELSEEEENEGSVDQDAASVDLDAEGDTEEEEEEDEPMEEDDDGERLKFMQRVCVLIYAFFSGSDRRHCQNLGSHAS